ncbi:MAG: DivIVA domain-containing protein [bacterium]
MKITPLDIHQQEFKRSMRGYDVEEVDEFLDMVADEYENLIKENASLKEQIKELVEKNNSYREIERAMESALMSVEKVKEDLRLNAEREAELVLRNAEIKANEIRSEAEQQVRKLRNEILELKKQRQLFEAKLRAAIEIHLRMLEESTKDEGGEVNPEIERYDRPESKS